MNDKEPKEIKTLCSICKDKKGKMSGQYCLESEKHPTYKERYDCWDGLTYLDCMMFIRTNETKEEHKIRINQKWNDKNKVEFDYV